MRARQSLGNPQARRMARPAIMASVLALATFGLVPSAGAQDSSADIRRLQAEVRALQRKVFPAGAGQTFQPEITAPPSAAPAAAATTSAVTDLLTRMDSIETQLARLTAQTEQNTNRIVQVEARLGPVGSPPAADAGTVGAGTVGTASGGTAGAGAGDAGSPPAAASASGPPAAQAGATPSDARVTAVRAIERPQSADAGDDEYSYGYRLWDAKFYPEAEQQLRLYLQKYPKHPRISYARNLLGRAYYDDGDPREAAKWFLQNYQADKAGARAADSLLYLAKTMKQLNDTKRACIALGEFASSYTAEAVGRLKNDYDDTRKGLACS